MQVLKILCDIWKSGANIYLDNKDDQIAIEKQRLIRPGVMKAAEEQFEEINAWFQSWKNASAEKVTIRKSLHHFCGWERNPKLEKWLSDDGESYVLLHDWTVVLAKNGWRDIYEDYREYETEESDAIASELYRRAVEYSKKGA